MREREIMAGNNEEWNKVESQAPVRFLNDGDSVEGKVTAIGEGNYNNKIYTIATKDGDKRVFGSAMLDRLCAQANVVVGSEVKFVYKGMARTSKGFPMKLFEVFTKD